MYSVLLPGDASFKRVFEENDPTAIILSGGPNSVHVKAHHPSQTGLGGVREKADPSLRYLLRDATDRSLFRRESGRLRERRVWTDAGGGYSDAHETIWRGY